MIGFERQRNHRLHIHGLIRWAKQIERPAYRLGHEIWNADRGWAWLESPTSQQAVVDYVTKYVAKSGDVHFSPNFDGRLPAWG